MIKVTYKDNIYEYPEGILLYDIAKDFEKDFKYPILIAKVDNQIEELSKTLEKRCNIDFYDRTSIPGNSCYSRAVHFLMLVAFKHILGNDADVKIEHSIDKGVYCTSLNKEINEKIILDVENEMKKMVSIDYKYVKLSVSRRDAIKFYKKKKST